MKFFRKNGALLLAGAMALSVAGCGNSAEPSAASTANTEEAATETEAKTTEAPETEAATTAPETEEETTTEAAPAYPITLNDETQVVIDNDEVMITVEKIEQLDEYRVGLTTTFDFKDDSASNFLNPSHYMVNGLQVRDVLSMRTIPDLYYDGYYVEKDGTWMLVAENPFQYSDNEAAKEIFGDIENLSMVYEGSNLNEYEFSVNFGDRTLSAEDFIEAGEIVYNENGFLVADLGLGQDNFPIYVIQNNGSESLYLECIPDGLNGVYSYNNEDLAAGESRLYFVYGYDSDDFETGSEIVMQLNVRYGFDSARSYEEFANIEIRYTAN